MPLPLSAICVDLNSADTVTTARVLESPRSYQQKENSPATISDSAYESEGCVVVQKSTSTSSSSATATVTTSASAINTAPIAVPPATPGTPAAAAPSVTTAGRKRKRMAADHDDLQQAEILIPPPNPRVKPPKRQMVWVDPDDAFAPWWWAGMVVPKEEVAIFKKTVNGVLNPGEGECVVVYFEDASYNVVKVSDMKEFCPYKPPYTTYVHGKNGKAFCADKAVVNATLYWELGRIPPAFTWLHSCPLEDRSKAGRLHGEDPPTTSKDAAESKRGPAKEGPTPNRRGSQAAIPRRESGAGKEAPSKGTEKTLGYRKVDIPITLQATPAAGKSAATPKSAMPIVNLNMTGPAQTPTSTNTKTKATSKSTSAQSQPAGRQSSFKRSREDSGGATSSVGSVCAKCGQRDSKARRASVAHSNGTNSISREEGILGLTLCQNCRRILDEVMPASHILEDEDDPIWKPERRHLRVLRNVLPEKNSDRLVRHFRSLQEVGQREREQALQRGTGIGGQAPFIGSAMAGPPPIPAGPPSLSSMTVFAQVPYAVSIATSNPLLLSTDNPSLAGTAMYATAPPPQAGPPIPSFSSSVPPHHAFPAPSAGPPSSSSTATSKPVHARQPPTQTSAAPVSSTPQPPPPLPPPPPATATATASVLLESRERADI